MSHVGIICPNTPGHLIAMAALADATRARGHRVTFFLGRASPIGLGSRIRNGFFGIVQC